MHLTAAGDSEAFGVIYQRHHQKLRSTAARITGPQDADDAVQDAFINAHRRAGQFKGDSAVLTWLHRIVVNAATDVVRRRKLVAENFSEPSDPACRIGQADRRMDLQKYWPRLSRDQQAAIHLVDIMGYPVAEAAQVEAVSEGTIKSRARRGRAVLAELLTACGLTYAAATA